MKFNLPILKLEINSNIFSQGMVIGNQLGHALMYISSNLIPDNKKKNKNFNESSSIGGALNF